MFVYEYSRYFETFRWKYDTLEEAFEAAWTAFEYKEAFFHKIVDTTTGKEYTIEDVWEWAEKNGLDDDEDDMDELIQQAEEVRKWTNEDPKFRRIFFRD